MTLTYNRRTVHIATSASRRRVRKALATAERHGLAAGAQHMMLPNPRLLRAWCREAGLHPRMNSGDPESLQLLRD